MRYFFTFGFYLLFTVVYAGFIFQAPVSPQVGFSEFKHHLFLAVLSVLFLAPPILQYFTRQYGAKALAFSAAPALIIGVVLYTALAARYYYTQRHPFDPFLQMPPPTFDPTSDRQPNSIRILTLGGSTTANQHLPLDKRYPNVLEQLLRRSHPELTIEVFNAGMDYYTMKHSLINYVTNMRDWTPDIVIVMEAINDLYRSFSDPDYTVGPYNRLWSHYYGPAINGALPPTFEQHILSIYAGAWFSALRYREEDMPLERYRSLGDFRRNVTTLVHSLQSDHARVVLMTQPSLYKDVMPNDERGVLWFGKTTCKEPRDLFQYAYPSPKSLAAAMRAFNDITIDVARAAGVVYVDLAAQIPKNLSFFVDDVHYTEKGAATVAGMVADAIEEINALAKTPDGALGAETLRSSSMALKESTALPTHALAQRTRGPVRGSASSSR